MVFTLCGLFYLMIRHISKIVVLLLDGSFVHLLAESGTNQWDHIASALIYLLMILFGIALNYLALWLYFSKKERELDRELRSIEHFLLEEKKRKISQKESRMVADFPDPDLPQEVLPVAAKSTDQNAWSLFLMQFEKSNPAFLSRLKAHFPQLTSSELRLCALVKSNLSMKEAAYILNVSITTVKMTRHRIRRKLGLTRKDNLFHFLHVFENEGKGKTGSSEISPESDS